ncbi:pyridoxamine 5'-phosphate oxidase family protein [Kitasatospora sp. NPDC058115]|uniref:pyridoxamine 5'-phosphate oxidase family protein n=1 Tax=Kitasatospora sp. NPDC058115 TaxID=3346347 RepID=UPI0036DC5631
MSGHLKRTKETDDLAKATAVLREGFVCVVAHVDTAATTPKCVPMVYAYHEEGDEKLLYLHGSTAWPDTTPPSLKHLWRDGGVPVCLTVTLVDALVVGRAAISTSLGYRSVVVDGIARKVGSKDRAKAIEAVTHQVFPGRWSELRPLKDGKGGELDTDGKHTPTTGVLSVSLTQDATVRSKTHAPEGPEHESQEDLDWDGGKAWGGILPIRQVYGPARPDQHVKQGTAVPDAVRRLVEHGRTA